MLKIKMSNKLGHVVHYPRSVWKFSYRNGTISIFDITDTESEDIVSIKNAILSHFQFKYQKKLDSTSDVLYLEEEDLRGSCLSTYKMEKRGSKHVLYRSRNLSECQKTDGTSGVLTWKNQLFELHWPSILLVDGNQICEAVLSNKRLESVKCTEKYQLREILHSNESQPGMASTFIESEMTLDKITEGWFLMDETQRFSEDPGLWERVSPSKQSQSFHLVAHILRTWENKHKNHDNEAYPDVFSSLVNVLREVDEENILYSSQQLPETIKSKIRNAFWSVNTRASTHFLSQSLLESRQKGSTSLSKWLISLAFLVHPSVEMVDGLEDIIRSGLLQPMEWLSISTLAHSACVQDESNCLKSAGVIALNKGIQAMITKSMTSHEQNHETRMLALKCFGNLGYLDAESRNLIKTILLDTNSSFQEKVSAIDGFRHMPCSSMRALKTTLHRMLKDETEDSTIRILSYLATIKCPELSNIRLAFNILKSCENQQVCVFIYKHLLNLQRKMGYTTKKIKNIFDKAADLKPLDSDPNKFSGNYIYKLDILKNLPVFLQFNCIFSSNSYIPIITSADVSVYYPRKSIKLIEIGGLIKGYDTDIASLLGPGSIIHEIITNAQYGNLVHLLENMFERYTSSRGGSTDFLSQHEKFKGEKALIEPPLLDVYGRMLGHEMAWVPSHQLSLSKVFEHVKNSIDLQGFPWETPDYAFRVAEVNLVYPTIMGMPLKFDLEVTASLDIISKTIGKQNKRKIKPKLAIQMKNHIRIGNSMIDAGSRTETNGHVGFDVVLTNLMKGHELNYELVIPQRQTILKLKSEMFMTHSKGKNTSETRINEGLNLWSIHGTHCLRIFESNFGLKLCQSGHVRNQFLSSPFMLPMPFEYLVVLKKSDPSITGYELKLTNSYEDMLGFEMAFDVVNGSLNRRINVGSWQSFRPQPVVNAHFNYLLWNIQTKAIIETAEDGLKVRFDTHQNGNLLGMEFEITIVNEPHGLSMIERLDIYENQIKHSISRGHMAYSTSGITFQLDSEYHNASCRGVLTLPSSDDHHYRVRDIEILLGLFNITGEALFKGDNGGSLGCHFDLNLVLNEDVQQKFHLKGLVEDQSDSTTDHLITHLDYFNTLIPDFNTKLKLESYRIKDDVRLAKGFFLADVWYGENYAEEIDNHISYSTHLTMDWREVIHFEQKTDIVAETLEYESHNKLLFHHGDNVHELIFHHSTNGEVYTLESKLDTEKTQKFSGVFNGKLEYPGLKLTSKNNIYESDGGEIASEGTLLMNSESPLTLQTLFGISEGIIFDVILKDAEENFKFVIINHSSRRKILIKLHLVAEGQQLFEYGLLWDIPVNGENSMKVRVSFLDHMGANLQVKTTRVFKEKEVGSHPIRFWVAEREVQSDWNVFHHNESVINGSLALRLAPDLTSGKLRLHFADILTRVSVTRSGFSHLPRHNEFNWISQTSGVDVFTLYVSENKTTEKKHSSVELTTSGKFVTNFTLVIDDRVKEKMKINSKVKLVVKDKNQLVDGSLVHEELGQKVTTVFELSVGETQLRKPVLFYEYFKSENHFKNLVGVQASDNLLLHSIVIKTVPNNSLHEINQRLHVVIGNTGDKKDTLLTSFKIEKRNNDEVYCDVYALFGTTLPEIPIGNGNPIRKFQDGLSPKELSVDDTTAKFDGTYKALGDEIDINLRLITTYEGYETSIIIISQHTDEDGRVLTNSMDLFLPLIPVMNVMNVLERTHWKMIESLTITMEGQVILGIYTTFERQILDKEQEMKLELGLMGKTVFSATGLVRWLPAPRIIPNGLVESSLLYKFFCISKFKGLNVTLYQENYEKSYDRNWDLIWIQEYHNEGLITNATITVWYMMEKYKFAYNKVLFDTIIKDEIHIIQHKFDPSYRQIFEMQSWGVYYTQVIDHYNYFRLVVDEIDVPNKPNLVIQFNNTVGIYSGPWTALYQPDSFRDLTYGIIDHDVGDFKVFIGESKGFHLHGKYDTQATEELTSYWINLTLSSDWEDEENLLEINLNIHTGLDLIYQLDGGITGHLLDGKSIIIQGHLGLLSEGLLLDSKLMIEVFQKSLLEFQSKLFGRNPNIFDHQAHYKFFIRTTHQTLGMLHYGYPYYKNDNLKELILEVEYETDSNNLFEVSTKQNKRTKQLNVKLHDNDNFLTWSTFYTERDEMEYDVLSTLSRNDNSTALTADLKFIKTALTSGNYHYLVDAYAMKNNDFEKKLQVVLEVLNGVSFDERVKLGSEMVSDVQMKVQSGRIANYTIKWDDKQIENLKISVLEVLSDFMFGIYSMTKPLSKDIIHTTSLVTHKSYRIQDSIQKNVEKFELIIGNLKKQTIKNLKLNKFLNDFDSENYLWKTGYLSFDGIKSAAEVITNPIMNFYADFDRVNHIPSYNEAADYLLETTWQIILQVLGKDSSYRSLHTLGLSEKTEETSSFSFIKQRIHETMNDIISKEEPSGNSLVQFYHIQRNEIIRGFEGNFMLLARLLRGDFGCGSNPCTGEIQFEAPLIFQTAENQYNFLSLVSGIQTKYLIQAYRKVSAIIGLQSQGEVAILDVSGSVTTFRGKSIQFAAACNYLLARDRKNSTFSLLGELKEEDMVLTLHSAGESVAIHVRNSTIFINNKQVEDHKDFYISNEYEVFQFYDHNSGIEILCVHKSLCRITVSGFMRGKVEGLLGSNSLEYSHEMEVNGVKMDQSMYLDHWAVTEDCPNPSSDKNLLEKTNNQDCQAFLNPTSTYGWCFDVEDSRPYYEYCVHNKHGSTRASELYSKACVLQTFKSWKG